MFDILQLIGGVILAVGYIPQIFQIIRTRSCKDLNLKTYLSVLVGIALMEAYAVDMVSKGWGVMFLITNTMSLALMLCICILITCIRLKEKPTKHATQKGVLPNRARQPENNK